MTSFLAYHMGTAQTSFPPEAASSLDDFLDELGNPEDKSPEQVANEWGFSDYEPTTIMTEQLLESLTPSAQEVQQCDSVSPESDNPQYTPSSSSATLDLPDDSDDVGVLFLDSSQLSSAATDGFVHISPFSSHSSTYSGTNSYDGTQSTGAATVYTDQSREVSSGPTSSPLSHQNQQQQQQWPSFTTVESDVYSTSTFADGTIHGFGGFSSAGPGSFGSIAGANITADTTLPLRPAPFSQPWPVTSLPITQGPSWGYMPQPMAHPSQLSYGHSVRQTTSAVPGNNAYTFPLNVGLHPAPPMSNQTQLLPFQCNTNSLHQNHAGPSVETTTIRQDSYQEVEMLHSTKKRSSNNTAAKSVGVSTARQGPRPLAVAGPSTHSEPADALEEQDTKAVKGGRRKHSHLNDQARKRSSAMRRKGACWRCKIQRDTCPDDGTPCQRCLNFFESHKNHQHFFACDRSKLPNFVMDFLPPSYTTMHSKQSIEDCVQEQVRYWDIARPVEVELTSGYGHPIRWTLYEFEPATLDLLGQFQYLQNVQTRQSERYEKWSPPLGIIKLETSDDWRLKNYLDDLMTDGVLPDFPWRCYDEESQFDHFQAQMLSLLCTLYLKKKQQETHDHELQPLLEKIIRMQIITYIMGHTLTITQETLYGVHSQLRNRNKPMYPASYTSPRLANRQLKFFFHILRHEIFVDILKWQQATFQTAARKDSTWLSTFTVMLAFAMVLEECQRTMQIQADAKARKRESSADAAQQEAYNACERIDARFGLLVGLFQHKYRDSKWSSNGSFGPQTPVLNDPAEHQFCQDLRELLVQKQQHLRNRKDVPFSSQNQCFYTTRLVARFLLPFLELPA
ncbi:hypothetical protein Q7P37_002524 [Cladosporium fusiforme]